MLVVRTVVVAATMVARAGDVRICHVPSKNFKISGATGVFGFLTFRNFEVRAATGYLSSHLSC